MPTPREFPPDSHPLDFTIANGQSLSGSQYIGGMEPKSIQTPAAIDGSVFTFQVSNDNTTFVNLYDRSGGEVTVQMAASRGVEVNPDDFRGWLYVKIRTGTAASPTVQSGGAVTVTLNLEQD